MEWFLKILFSQFKKCCFLKEQYFSIYFMNYFSISIMAKFGNELFSWRYWDTSHHINHKHKFMDTFRTEMLTLPGPQSPICNLFQVFLFRCMEFHVNTTTETGVIKQETGSSQETVNFNSDLSRCGSEVLLTSWQRGSTQVPSSELASLRPCCVVERADCGGLRKPGVGNAGGTWEWGTRGSCPKPLKSF